MADENRSPISLPLSNATDEEKRRRATMAALELIRASALGGGAVDLSSHVPRISDYRDAILEAAYGDAGD